MMKRGKKENITKWISETINSEEYRTKLNYDYIFCSGDKIKVNKNSINENTKFIYGRSFDYETFLDDDDFFFLGGLPRFEP